MERLAKEIIGNFGITKDNFSNNNCLIQEAAICEGVDCDLLNNEIYSILFK